MTTGTVIYTAVWQGLGNARLLLCDNNTRQLKEVLPRWFRISDGMCLVGTCCYLSGLSWIMVSLVISTLSLPALHLRLERMIQEASFYLGFRRDFVDSFTAVLSGLRLCSVFYSYDERWEFIFQVFGANLLVRVAEDRNLDVEVLNQVRAKVWLRRMLSSLYQIAREV